jgi:hypothetical protein
MRIRYEWAINGINGKIEKETLLSVLRVSFAKPLWDSMSGCEEQLKKLRNRNPLCEACVTNTA